MKLEQKELRTLINKLNEYGPRTSKEKRKKIEEKNRVLESARKLSDARDEIIGFFEKGTFPYKGNVFKAKEEEESEENKLEKIKDNYKRFFKYIEDESRSISYELFEKHFHFVSPTVLAKQLYETKIKRKMMIY